MSLLRAIWFTAQQTIRMLAGAQPSFACSVRAVALVQMALGGRPAASSAEHSPHSQYRSPRSMARRWLSAQYATNSALTGTRAVDFHRRRVSDTITRTYGGGSMGSWASS